MLKFNVISVSSCRYNLNCNKVVNYQAPSLPLFRHWGVVRFLKRLSCDAMFWLRVSFCLAVGFIVSANVHIFQTKWTDYDAKYSSFPESKRLEMLESVREMFTFGYDNYMKFAFPKDELDPIHCTGRGPDYENP